MVEVCKTYRTVLALVRPAVAKQLLIPGKTSSAVHRYATRSDEQKPSLFLPGNIVGQAENVFQDTPAGAGQEFPVSARHSA